MDNQNNTNYRNESVLFDQKDLYLLRTRLRSCWLTHVYFIIPLPALTEPFNFSAGFSHTNTHYYDASVIFKEKTFLFLSPCLTLWSLSSPSWSYTSVWPAQWYHCRCHPIWPLQHPACFSLGGISPPVQLFLPFPLAVVVPWWPVWVTEKVWLMMTKGAQTEGQLCLQLTANPDPDKAGRPSHHSGKYPFLQPQEGKSTDW